jgi:hypothetical protein
MVIAGYMLLGLAAFLTVIGLFYVPASRSGVPPEAAAKVELWILLAGVQAVIWATGLVLVIREARLLLTSPLGCGFLPGRGSTVRTVGPPLALMIALFAGVSANLRPPTWTLQPYPVRPDILTLLGVAASLVAFAGVWLVHSLLDSLLEKLSEQPEKSLQWFLLLRRALSIFLGTAAAILAAGVVGSSTLRKAVLALRNAGETFSELEGRYAANHFPLEHVILFGLFFTLLIGLGYGPTHSRLLMAASRLRETLTPLTESEESWKKRKELDQLLALPQMSLQSLGAVLGPVASALLALLLPGGS